jgi:integrase
VVDVDLAAGVINVEYGWDVKEGQIKLKSHAGRRRVPVPGALRDLLDGFLGGSTRRGMDLIFGRTAETPFEPKSLKDRATDAWKKVGLQRLTLHDCRHTYASLMIAAGVNPKALQTFMGHANISITYDRYGHLMPGSEQEAAGLLDSYLEAQRKDAEGRARAAAPKARGPVVGQ